MLRLKEYQNFLADPNRLLEEQVAARTQELRDAYKKTIYTMVRRAEFKDEDTGTHLQRIRFYCRDIAEEMGMDTQFCDEIFYASPMHDIGKIAVLLKLGRFTPQKWAVMKGHSAHPLRPASARRLWPMRRTLARHLRHQRRLK